MPVPFRARPLVVGALGAVAFVLIGWSGLLMPSLIRSVKDAFDQTDAGMGVYYFLYATAYAAGSFGGGLATERLGRRWVLSLAAALHGIGLVALGIAPSWGILLVAALPAGLGAGTVDGGVNGLFLDLFPTGRGRALNLLHLFFSLGALTAPLAVGRLVEDGVAWGSILVASGLVALVIGALFVAVTMPDGRRRREGAEATGARGADAARVRLATPLLLLGIAIACYVASEVGVSNWLVRFLEPAPLTVATTALSLFWAGLTLGRLVAARIADRFDHVRFTATAAFATAVLLVAAVLAPSLPLSIGLFALAGFATGPVFPMIVAIGGDRYPDRAAAVSGFLTGFAVAGSIVYPPIMGFLSVTVGLDGRDARQRAARLRVRRRAPPRSATGARDLADRCSEEPVAVAPPLLLVEGFGHDVEGQRLEPGEDPAASRIEVVARHVALDDLAANDGQTEPLPLGEGRVDLRFRHLLDREVQAGAGVDGLHEVREDGRPRLGRHVLHGIDRHRPVERVLEPEFLEADLVEFGRESLAPGHGEHAGRLVSADDAPPARADQREVAACATRGVEHDPVGRTGVEQTSHEDLMR